MIASLLLCLLPLIFGQYAVGPSFGGFGGYSGGGCGCGSPCSAPRPCLRRPSPCSAPRPCAPPQMPVCPPPTPCPPQFCPPPPICPPPPPPMPCPQPRPSCPQQPMYVPVPVSYPTSPGCGSPVPMPRIPAQNDCCCGCSSPCRFASRRRAYGAKTLDPACNSKELKRIITENIGSDASESKRIIQKIAEKKMDHMVNVICGTGSFSYIAHTDMFCQSSKDDVTCYAFKPL